MRCCKWPCGEEKPTALGPLSKENKQLSRDMIKAYKIMKPAEKWERQCLFTISYFAKIRSVKTNKRFCFIHHKVGKH